MLRIDYFLLILSTNSFGVSISIFEKPNHFLPKSFMDAFVAMRRFMVTNAEVFQRLSTMEYHQLEMQQHQQETDKRIEDRFLCIDDDVYHIGASIKDLGKKWFGFSKMEILTPDELVERINRG